MHQDAKEKEQKEQKELKQMASFQNIMGKLSLVIVLGFMLCAIVMLGIKELKGNSTNGAFGWGIIFLLIIVACVVILNKIPVMIHENGIKKGLEWQPLSMEEVRAQGWTLEKVLHKMPSNNALIVWDTLWGFFTVMFVFAKIFLGGNVFVYVIIGDLAAILIVGHLIIKNVCKNAKYSKKVIKYTKSACGKITNEQEFVKQLDDDVKNRILYQSKYFVLTDNWMIGGISDIYFNPVAIPRAFVKEISFSFTTSVSNNNRAPIGTLICILLNGKVVKLLIGDSKYASKTFKILQMNNIAVSVSEEEYRY